ncbi:MAG: RNA polymerase sigma-70 factor [Alistipes sp.]|uniref:RNA polymerase sigma-70 factor n=1 Tax=Alistipes sp. TaxID=1872444 RepID=UPI0023F44691|nr:RNA polymerase sigma-70 factor [Alistipes sp.]MBQ7892923.1 RNA polymerase sigma-70 factor [Alistipes sp.]
MDTASSFSQQLFEQLFRQYKRKYLLIANSYVRDSKTAEDIVHDSFMAVWEHRNDITGTNIEAYLYKIIRNNCLMYRRNRQIGQAVYEQIKLKERSTMDYYTRAIESCDPDTLLQDEILEICRTQLEQMPELTQQIFKARRLEGKSYKEIAEQFGIPQKKVDKQLQQAVIKLRRALKDFFSIIFTM